MSATVRAAAIPAERARAVAAALARIRAIERAKGVTLDALTDIRAELYGLAARRALFPKADFPPPEGPESRRYLLSEDADHRFALYMNSLNPGKKTPPHNHTTWAVVVAVEGEELNRFYRRLDDGRTPGRARLELTHEEVVRPGVGVMLLPDDIHSIHVTGHAPTLHLHMYGRALEVLHDRVGFDLEAGTVAPYAMTNPTVR